LQFPVLIGLFYVIRDGVAFLDDKVVFCEFKTASSTLNENQKRIKRLVSDRKVEWLELKIR
jgi:predicted Holliday junction resolvase-like endonuclease